MSNASGSIGAESTILQAGRSRFRDPKRSLNYLNLLNPSSRTIFLGFTQSLTEMNTRRNFGGEVRTAGKADNLTVICEPIV
jgi:hypothetical protein